jgi:hypothetical protein
MTNPSDEFEEFEDGDHLEDAESQSRDRDALHGEKDQPVGDGEPAEPDEDFQDIFRRLGESFRNGFGFGADEMDCVLRDWLSGEIHKKLQSMGRSYEAIAADLKWQFNRMIRQPYMAGFSQAVDRQQSFAALGRRYGKDRATVKRWLDGDSDPSLEAFCIVSAADDCKYPHGHMVALGAYRAILQSAQRLVGRQNVVSVTLEDALCLYLQMRNRLWWQAWFDGDDRMHQQAASVVSDILHTQFQSQKTWDLEEQRAVLAELWFEWSLIESVVKYEWF